jgi:dTDP-D-glucose 4,6-dehydratase
LDVTRAEQEFKFRAATPFELGLRKTIDWYLGSIKSKQGQAEDSN